MEKGVSGVRCADCGTVSPMDAKYCPSCGARLHTEAMKQDPVVKRLITKRVIAEDENVLFITQQKRWYKLFWPGQIIVTDVQVIFYTKTWFGYSLDTYGYDFFHNISVRKGPFSSKISFVTRLGVAKMVGLPHDAASDAMHAIGKGIRARIQLQTLPLRREAEVVA
jgi:hypothetical protein